MRASTTTSFILSLTGAVLLSVIGLFGSNQAQALTVDPNASLPGIPMAGTPSFNFNDLGGDYSNTIDSWFTNLVYVQSNGIGNGYTLYAYAEGNFTFYGDPSTSYEGTDGVFNLQADFDDAGNLLGGGTVTIDGIIPDIGINSSTQLMSADLSSYAFQDDLVGFAIDNITCAPEVAAFDCQTGPESIYFFTAGNFPDIGSLAGEDYQTTMASKTTVPVPAAVWLMLSGLGLLGTFAYRKKHTAA